MLRIPALLAAATLSVTPSLADEFFVDPVFGNNANDGRSAATAWRTLGHALGQVNGTVQHTVHALAGAHFLPATVPIAESISVVGEGPEDTLVTCTAITAFRFVDMGGAPASVNLRGVTILGAIDALEANAGAGVQLTATVENVVVRSSSLGLEAEPAPSGRTRVVARGLRIEGAAIGIRMSGNARLDLDDSALEDCIFAGILATNLEGQAFLPAGVVVRRSRIEGTAGDGVRCSGERVLCSVLDSLIAGGGTDGVDATGVDGNVFVMRSTVADNGGAGLRVGRSMIPAAVRGTILAGNGTDVVDPFGVASVASTLVADGSVAGPMSGDPGFVDPAMGDYRLRGTSQALDLAPTAVPLDLTGRSRYVDSDLDLQPTADLGALELYPLERRSAAVAGLGVDLEVTGPANARALLVLAPAPSVAPATTPYGTLALDPATAWRVQFVPLSADGRPVAVSLPLTGATQGDTWSVQAWIESLSAPNGAAFSNALLLTIE